MYFFEMILRALKELSGFITRKHCIKFRFQKETERQCHRRKQEKRIKY